MAPKSSSFLRFVVLQTLNGNANRIKAYTIAVDVLGKPTTFDPQDDPSVRVMAKQLRDMLGVYHSQSLEHEVVVQMHPGSYVPLFVVSDNIQRKDKEFKTNCS